LDPRFDLRAERRVAPDSAATGQAQFFLPSTADRRYAIQVTKNFVQWTSILTNVATGTFLDSVGENAPNFPYRFHRSELLEP
jgi:hypothetical protein